MNVCDSRFCFRRNSDIAHQCQRELDRWCLKLMVSWKVLPGRLCLFGMATRVCVEGRLWCWFIERCPFHLSFCWDSKCGFTDLFDDGETVLLEHSLLPVAEVIKVRALLQGFLQKGRDETWGRLCRPYSGPLLSQRHVFAGSFNASICLLWSGP